MATQVPRGAIIRLVGSLAAVFILSQFYRTAVAVIAPDLVRDPGLSAQELGALTGAFFFAMAVMQLPVGVLLDRFGPRRTVPSQLVLAVVGALVISAADSATTLIVGQVLIGLGCAGVFMGGLVAISRWFRPARFATVAALLTGTSGLGNLLSATPFAALTEEIGWRATYAWLAGLTALLALILYAFLRDAPPGHPYHTRTPERLAGTLAGLRQVLRHPEMPGILTIAFVSFSTIFAIRALWAGPYLADVHGLGALERGNVLLVMGLAMIVGVAVYGPLDRVFKRRHIIFMGAGTSTVILSVLALAPNPALWQVTALFAGLSLFSAYYIHVLSHTRSLFEDRLIGRAITATNFAAFTGVGVMQVVPGFIVGGFEGGDSAIAYRWVFALLAAAVVIALAIYVRAGRKS